MQKEVKRDYVMEYLTKPICQKDTGRGVQKSRRAVEEVRQKRLTSAGEAGGSRSDLSHTICCRISQARQLRLHELVGVRRIGFAWSGTGRESIQRKGMGAHRP